MGSVIQGGVSPKGFTFGKEIGRGITGKFDPVDFY